MELPGVARAAGLARVCYKDEGDRFELGSFKALGGAYAVARVLARHRGPASTLTVCCATDGNHGRSVAWGARRCGCACVIYLHAHVSEARAEAIAALGARRVRDDGNYDDSVRRAAEDARRNGWQVVSDTSWEGYTEVPRDVMCGYVVMVDEILAALPEGEIPSHVFVQGGVGGLAAAVLARLWHEWGERRPRFVVVEPRAAACLYASADAGEPTAVGGDLDTVMAGLSCGEPSLVAWPILAEGADAFMVIDDDEALGAMRLLADAPYGDPPVVGGESGVAGLAGMLAAARAPALREPLGLDAGASVLLFGTEGATDPALYARVVGRSAAEVRGA